MGITEIFELVGTAAVYGIGFGTFVLVLGYAVGGVLSILKQAK